MKTPKLSPKTVQIFNWDKVISAFEAHTGMSFNSHGCWGLDYTKICGEPDLRHHHLLRFEQKYLISYNCHAKAYCEGDLQKIFNKSERKEYGGKQYYSIPFGLVLDYLVFHDILPEDNFFVTNLTT